MDPVKLDYYWPRPHSQTQTQTWLQSQLHLVLFWVELPQATNASQLPICWQTPAQTQGRAMALICLQLTHFYLRSWLPPTSWKIIWTKFLFWRWLPLKKGFGETYFSFKKQQNKTETNQKTPQQQRNNKYEAVCLLITGSVKNQAQVPQDVF